MAKVTVTQSDNPGNSVSYGFTIMDEFIPIVQLNNAGKIKKEDGTITLDSKKITLSGFIDSPLRSFNPYGIITKKRKLKLEFSVKKGCADSKDDDGIIEAKLSVKDPLIKIISPSKIEAKINSIIKVEIEIKSKEKKEFYIDFYASDNKGDTYSEGELKNVHCGRLQYIFDYCVCVDWATVAPVIPTNKFIGWDDINHPDWQCYDYAVEQLRVAGHKVLSPGWDNPNKKGIQLNDDIFQLFIEEDVAGMKTGVQKAQYKEGVKYLREALQKGIPVMAGVDDDYKKYNKDKTTEHFIVIVGMGEDSDGKYFLFYDNAIGDATIGASSDNKLYCKCIEQKLIGEGDLNNSYLHGYVDPFGVFRDPTAKDQYIVTQIRKTK